MNDKLTQHLSIELPTLDAARLERLARSLDSTPSEIVRRALLVYAPGLEEHPTLLHEARAVLERSRAKFNYASETLHPAFALYMAARDRYRERSRRWMRAHLKYDWDAENPPDGES